jgi:2-amino-4-hydroxy-6-hydroxymethyldihydropteridine diphosphokinase
VTERLYLALGSNVGKERNLPRAVALLAGLLGGPLAAVSRVYETSPVGTVAQPVFWNAAVLAETVLTAGEVKRRVIPEIESRLGRVRDPRDRNAPRTIDVDVVLWGDRVGEVEGRPLPDPDLLRFAHVAVPLAEIAPDLRHPVDGRRLAAIARELVARDQAAGLPPPRPVAGVRLAPGGPED